MSLGGAPPELISQVRDGVVDLIWTVNGYTPGLFPRTEVFELPFIHTNDIKATNLAIRAMFDEHLAEEYKGVKVMFLHSHAGQAIQMVKDEVRKPEDLAGKKMRIPTRTGAWVIEALGAAPAAMPVPDIPQAFSKGVVDGALIPWEIIPALKLQDQTEYQVEGHDMTRFGTTIFQVSMNVDKWNSLPADIQQLFVKVATESSEMQIKNRKTSDDAAEKAIADAGVQINDVSAEERQKMREAVQPMYDEYIEQYNMEDLVKRMMEVVG